MGTSRVEQIISSSIFGSSGLSSNLIRSTAHLATSGSACTQFLRGSGTCLLLSTGHSGRATLSSLVRASAIWVSCWAYPSACALADDVGLTTWLSRIITDRSCRYGGLLKVWPDIRAPLHMIGRRLPEDQTNYLLIGLQVDQLTNSQMCSGRSGEHLLRRTATNLVDVA